MSIDYIITSDSVITVIEGQPKSILKSNPLYSKVVESLKNKDWEGARANIDAAWAITTYSKNSFSIENGSVMVDGKKIPFAISEKILKFREQNLPYKPLVNFARQLSNNPSERAQTDLFQFLEHNGHPITEAGTFIAYKKVTKTDIGLLDIYTKTMSNNIGDVVEMPRDKVNPDPNVTCSHGLHVAAWEYAAKHYGSQDDVILEVEVSPTDVVAIPIDYNNMKMRVSKYRVLSIRKNPYSDKLLVSSEKSSDNENSDNEGDEAYEYEDC